MELPILPVFTIGSYPPPLWYRQELGEADIRRMLESPYWGEPYRDAVRLLSQEQVVAGLDLVTDPAVWYDAVSDIRMFLLYWPRRIRGVTRAPNTQLMGRASHLPEWQREFLKSWGEAYMAVEAVEPGPMHTPDLFLNQVKGVIDRPLKPFVGAGPAQQAGMIINRHYDSRGDLARALGTVFNHELRALDAAGADVIQLDDLGAWFALMAGGDFSWAVDAINNAVAGVGCPVWHHICLGNVLGTPVVDAASVTYKDILPHLAGEKVQAFLLEFASHPESADADLAAFKEYCPDFFLGAGVIDVHSLLVETPEQIAAWVQRLVKYIEPERLFLTADCGMRQFPRPTAYAKMQNLARGAALARRQLGLEGRTIVV